MQPINTLHQISLQFLHKIVELIKWVEDEYAHGNYKIDYDTNEDGEDLLSKVLNYKIGDLSLKDLISKAGTGITDLLSKLF